MRVNLQRHNAAMNFSWLTHWLQRPTRTVISDQLWQQSIQALPFFIARKAEEQIRIRALADAFLQSKEMSGAGGLELNAHMQIQIAVQACLPILNLGLTPYDGWNSIVVYPDTFVVPRRETDEDGVVHEFDDAIAGEAWDGGPLLLSWRDVAESQNEFRSACNVVIHEFAHKLDMRNGLADGMPDFNRSTHPELNAQHWRRTLEDAYQCLVAEIELIENDAETAAAYAHLPLDPYAAEDLAEFFAVSSEAFFTDATHLAAAFPEWTRLLSLYFKQAPLYPT